jgi:hypothetical protein
MAVPSVPTDRFPRKIAPEAARRARLAASNPDPDRRHERRALTPNELARLIEAAESGAVVLKLAGPDRRAGRTADGRVPR